MNIYSLHANPESLNGYRKDMLTIPEVALTNLKYNFPELLISDKLDIAINSILKQPQKCYAYALYSGEAFKKGEPTIAKSAQFSLLYATKVLHKRFPLGEPVIKKDPELWDVYTKEFIK